MSTSTTLNRYHNATSDGSTRAMSAGSCSPLPSVPNLQPKQGPQRDAAGGRRASDHAAGAPRAVGNLRSSQTPVLRPQQATGQQVRATSASPQTAQAWPQEYRSEAGADEASRRTQERAEELASYGYICYGGDSIGSLKLKESGAGGGDCDGGGRGVICGSGGGSGGGGEHAGGQRPRSQSQSRVLSC
jgi:hypothetical protein